ncbi:hypothetical protein O181_071796 [Austropuccinia psidii MF-1]|uniref:Uncharacterized protein n=1 Tax=Austropuccinia psidii MF-1 TaxID=1389203 RepID=A0A9Q3F1E1_9BASI|nr:hypothetical protein [Austropuccinia psidii MF-1]
MFLLQDLTPFESLHHIHLKSLNRLLTGLGAQKLTIQGRGYCHNHGKTASQLAFMASQATTNAWPIGHIINPRPSDHSWCGMALGPYPWPQTPNKALRSYPAPLALLSNFQPHQPPGQYP